MTCLFCEEAILEGEHTRTINGNELVHLECLIRNVIGSVGHQRKQCQCWDVEDISEIGLTEREAARNAFAEWEKSRGQGI